MNNKILFLHMGLPKTGSSALQVFFAKNNRLLYKHGVRYPGAVANVAAEERITSGNGARFARHAFSGDSSDHPSAGPAIAMVDRALSAGDRHVLLSSEYFAPWTKEQHHSLKEFAARHGYHVKPILYLRDQGDITVTHYFQHLKRRPGVVDISGAGFHSFAEAYARGSYLDFHTLIQTLESVYGVDAPIVGTTRRDMLRGNSLLTDAVASMDLDPKEFDFDVPKINPTPTQQEMYVRALIGLFNPSVEFSDLFLRTVSTLHERLDRTGRADHNFFIDPDVVTSIRERFSESNRLVCSRWFGGKTPEEVFEPRTYGPKIAFNTTTIDLDTVIAIFGGMMVELANSSSSGMHCISQTPPSQ